MPDNSSDLSHGAVSYELKLYQAFILPVPILFVFILLLVFYLFFVRGRQLDWSSLRISTFSDNMNDISRNSGFGLKKELRELLPIVIYKKSFSVSDTQCSICLVEYEAENKLQQIPACGHTFHMECIDHWLATHTTCPLCRLSLVPPARIAVEASDLSDTAAAEDNGAETSASDGESQTNEVVRNGEERTVSCSRAVERVPPHCDMDCIV